MEALVIFAKTPHPGTVKTRLAQTIGDDAACQLYRGMLEDTVRLGLEWQGARTADPNRRVCLQYAGDAPDELRALAARWGIRAEPQVGEGLGARMANALDQAFESGARSACVIGTDCPHIPMAALEMAFRSMRFEPATLGPTFDGGYWLVGSARPRPDLFDGIVFSTPTVMAQTLALLAAQNVAPHLLEFLYDVDTIDDVDRLVWHLYTLAQRPHGAPRLQNTIAALHDIGFWPTERDGAPWAAGVEDAR